MASNEPMVIEEQLSTQPEQEQCKRRKHEAESIDADMQETNTQINKEKHGNQDTNSFEQNSRSAETPKILEITSSHQQKVNKEYNQTDPHQMDGDQSRIGDPQIQIKEVPDQMMIDDQKDEYTQPLSYSEIVKNDEPKRRTGQPSRGLSEDDKTWMETATGQLAELNTDEFDEEKWHYGKILEAFVNEKIMQEFVAYKLTHRTTKHKIPTAIELKFKYRDKSFFRTFARNAKFKPAHQMEFEKIYDQAVANYKGKHSITVTNREIRDQINKKVRQKTAINFLTNYKMTKQPQEIVKILEYCKGFMKVESDLTGDKLWTIANLAIQDTLKALPADPEGISEEIREYLPFNLPIKGRYKLRVRLAILRKIYTFTELPETYFIPLEQLPEDPKDLNSDTQGMFPIKDRRDLKKVLGYKQKLEETYKWEGKLPDKYFNLPERKKPLPIVPQILSARFREMFPIDLTRTNMSIKDISDKLREEYHFKFIPNDFFVQRPRLPTDTSRIRTKTKYTYPIQDIEEAKSFIKEIRNFYSYTLPIPRHIMEVNPTNKPTLPENIEEIKEYNITTPITTARQLVETVRLLRQTYYFHRIPEEWIEITNKKGTQDIAEEEVMEIDRLEVPKSLEEMQKILDEIETDCDRIKIPITEQEEVRTTLEELKLIFDIQKAPDYLFQLKPLPEATWDIIP
ncbi:hypothetical protein C2G38_2288705 [Gigaspora rosea]|uniref:Uncharacterized protein n=1 Tax=Gigaspora rosea TaxID=44941 RepID=A0A397U2D1_9GLOM|nr:hypothetical protein C2G38_2288705 [Gigaspora rosea]